MPGTLMYECCLHTLRIFLMRMGWIGEEGEITCEPIPEVPSRLKCRGQVIASTKIVTYEVTIKELGYRPEAFAIADALMYADGKPIVEITDMTLRMTGLTKERLQEIWNPSSESDIQPAIFDTDRILAFAVGKPSEAFGEPYRIFDDDRTIARLPGPPYKFLDRITRIHAEPWKMVAGGEIEAQYDVPLDAWYFEANRSNLMPFSILLEVALQPCGWLAAFIGSALTSKEDLSFRNLGGSAIQYLPVTPDMGTLTTHVKITKVSNSAGMIIQHYDYRMTSRGRDVYQGNTYFGFFSKSALANQIGIRDAKWVIPEGNVQSPIYEVLPHEHPFPDSMLRMIDKILWYTPHNSHGLDAIEGSIAVDPDFWFFKAHFYQDPVWPGSLGLESFIQLLKYLAWKRWGEPRSSWQTVALNQKHEWIYRGQVIPRDEQVRVQALVTSIDDENRLLRADGFLMVDERIIYQMKDFTLQGL
jgi:3-hydroxymyristoyl/3-hydroxydecanoyl-(acyl carrier protein) dehydratase